MTALPLTYAQVHDWDNLYQAWRKAAKGKRSRSAAARFEYRLEQHPHATSGVFRNPGGLR